MRSVGIISIFSDRAQNKNAVLGSGEMHFYSIVFQRFGAKVHWIHDIFYVHGILH